MLEPQANPAARDKTQLVEPLARPDPREPQVLLVHKEPQETLEPPLKVHPANLVMQDLRVRNRICI